MAKELFWSAGREKKEIVNNLAIGWLEGSFNSVKGGRVQKKEFGGEYLPTCHVIEGPSEDKGSEKTLKHPTRFREKSQMGGGLTNEGQTWSRKGKSTVKNWHNSQRLTALPNQINEREKPQRDSHHRKRRS